MKANFESIEWPLYQSPMKERNIEKFGERGDMCECCGKTLLENEALMVHMNTNWMAMDNSIKTDTDAMEHGFETQGYFYIGNSCAKKMPSNFLHHGIFESDQLNKI
jgi:hypothetical protein